MKIFFFLLLSVIVLSVSCKKTNSNEANLGPVLQKVVITNANSIYTSIYTYNSQNKLTEIKTSSNFYSWKSIQALEYDARNRLRKITHYSTDSNATTYHNADSFQYDMNNRVLKTTYIALSPTTTSGENHSYAYDITGRLIADTSIPTTANSRKRYISFVYDSNNNVSKRKEYYSDNTGAYTLLYQYEMNYDNKQNPYKNLESIAYFLSTDNYVMNATNLTRRYRSGDQAEILTHSYDVNGRVVKTIAYPELRPDLSSTYEYFYF